MDENGMYHSTIIIQKIILTLDVNYINDFLIVLSLDM
jgi:hypothetical protein